MKTNHILPFLPMLLFAISACHTAPQFHVRGTISEATDSMLYLEAITLNGVERLDSVRLKSDGSFHFSADAPTNPEFYVLRIGAHRINFSIDSTESVTFETRLPVMSTDYRVEGSYNSQKIKEIVQQQMRLQSSMVALESNRSMYPGDIVDSINSLIAAYKERMKVEYIYKEPMQAYAYYAVCQSVSDLNGVFQVFNPLSDRDDVKCYAAVATAWDGLYPDADRTIQLCNMTIRGMSNTMPPAQRVIEVDDSLVHEVSLIDVNLPDIGGHVRTLTELKGTVVMLDFTAYGMEGSAERTRKMRDLYEKYRGRGFEIYQVSLDDDNHFWKLSCEKLPWVCVHETNGTATRLYGVAKLPTYFLINRDNEVVVRSDMVQTSLEDELLKLL